MGTESNNRDLEWDDIWLLLLLYLILSWSEPYNDVEEEDQHGPTV